MTAIRSRSFTEFLRFFVASFGGVIFDVLLSYALVHFFVIPLLAASTISLLSAASLMYFVHERWTFENGGQFSGKRLVGTIVSALAALLTRTIVLTGLTLVLNDTLVFLQLLAAVGTSFIVNYLLVRRIIRRTNLETN